MKILNNLFQITLDANPALEQRACKSCKTALDRFAEFSCKVELNQKKLQKIPEIVVVKIDESEYLSENEEVQVIESESEQQFEVVELKPNSRLDFVSEEQEPASKKLKAIEVEDSNLLEEVAPNDRTDRSKKTSDQNGEARPLRRSRRKSVHEKAQISRQATAREEPRHSVAKERKYQNFKQVLERTESLFKNLDASCCEQIEIPKAKLSKDGEVPREWLSDYENFKTWDEFTFVCKEHCKIKFDNLFSYCVHQEQVPRTNRMIQCNQCQQQFKGCGFLASFINHTAANHYQHLKFCCIVCSRVFFNMPSLLQHCKSQHGDIELYDVYPCLECGAYKFSYTNLKTHKAVHDK